ncbi:MAG: response regulator [Polyangiaceae bacterium]|nr:response regulator [Polyangiaceae bacterium]MCE7888366.1 response regulator [Sorangiineae bacterium PRO1]MCL4749505.1 response regulator [Myxococcales bacterium]
MNPTSPLILVVEDEPQMRRFLRGSLGTHGYRILEAVNGEEGLARAAAHSPDVVLLDLGLPDLDGLEVTRRLRQWTSLPVIVISARGRDEDKVRALDAGADDYLTKPFSVAELLARIRVALRHAGRGKRDQEESTFRVGDLRIEFARRQVFAGEAEVHLTPTEYKLLSVLARHAGRVLTHRQLLREVWGPEHVGHTEYLRVFVGQLRHKLEATPARPRYLVNEPAVGYLLKVD